MAGKPIAAFALVAVVSTLPASSNRALTAYKEIAAANVDKIHPYPQGCSTELPAARSTPSLRLPRPNTSRPTSGWPNDTLWHKV